MMLVLVYAAADAFQKEAGLLATTVMGIALANQRYVSIRQITHFKENLRVLIISSLFIILSARLTLSDGLGTPASWFFVLLLIVLVRPLVVLVSTWGAGLPMAERLFLSWMAPRGIVAAAVVSVFALRLEESGQAGFGAMVPLTFQVIIGTVAVYGLTAPIVARRLKLAQPNPQGVLFAGAAPWVQQAALALKQEGIAVVLVDTNWSHVAGARREGLAAYYANVLSEDLELDIRLDGIGRLLAVTPNHEVNALATLHFIDLFGSSEVYQLPPEASAGGPAEPELPRHLRGRYLFAEGATFEEIAGRYSRGHTVKVHSITEQFDLEAFHRMYGDEALPLFVVSGDRLVIATVQDGPKVKAGDRLISLVPPAAAAGETTGGQDGETDKGGLNAR